jgi:hypothetical protein
MGKLIIEPRDYRQVILHLRIRMAGGGLLYLAFSYFFGVESWGPYFFAKILIESMGILIGICIAVSSQSLLSKFRKKTLAFKNTTFIERVIIMTLFPRRLQRELFM